MTGRHGCRRRPPRRRRAAWTPHSGSRLSLPRAGFEQPCSRSRRVSVWPQHRSGLSIATCTGSAGTRGLDSVPAAMRARSVSGDRAAPLSERSPADRRRRDDRCRGRRVAAHARLHGPRAAPARDPVAHDKAEAALRPAANRGDDARRRTPERSSGALSASPVRWDRRLVLPGSTPERDFRELEGIRRGEYPVLMRISCRAGDRGSSPRQSAWKANRPGSCQEMTGATPRR